MSNGIFSGTSACCATATVATALMATPASKLNGIFFMFPPWERTQVFCARDARALCDQVQNRGETRHCEARPARRGNLHQALANVPGEDCFAALAMTALDRDRRAVRASQ